MSPVFPYLMSQKYHDYGLTYRDTLLFYFLPEIDPNTSMLLVVMAVTMPTFGTLYSIWLVLSVVLTVGSISLWSMNAVSYIDGLCKSYLMSMYETVAILSMFASLVVLSMTTSFAFDDLLDFQVVFVFVLVSLTMIMSLSTMNMYLLYSISSNSNGESLKKVMISDIVNIALCFIRVLLCWTRYIFYDMQLEFVDMALQHTDEMFAYQTDDSAYMMLLITYLDIFYFLLQMVLSLFKMAIASFLLWLMLDLFMLKPMSSTYLTVNLLK